jgi:hypothetical protein
MCGRLMQAVGIDLVIIVWGDHATKGPMQGSRSLVLSHESDISSDCAQGTQRSTETYIEVRHEL